MLVQKVRRVGEAEDLVIVVQLLRPNLEAGLLLRDTVVVALEALEEAEAAVADIAPGVVDDSPEEPPLAG
jgi:hypothetical protein